MRLPSGTKPTPSAATRNGGSRVVSLPKIRTLPDRAGVSPTWIYQLDFPSPVKPERGAPHMHDIPLVFGTLGAPGSLTGTGEAAQRLSQQMMGAFAAVARTGRPVAAGLPVWPRYTLADRSTMIFDARSRVEKDPRKWERELFARVPYVQPGS